METKTMLEKLDFDGISLPEREELETALERLESKVGHIHAEDYRDFILSSNGASPKDEWSNFNFKGSENGSELLMFFSLISSVDNASRTLEWNLSTLSNRIPSNFLPIGEDSGGNCLLLGLAPEQLGEVWFWDHEEEADAGEEPDMSNMILVADSFKEFMEGLYEYKWEYPPSLYKRFILALRNNWEKVFPPR
ncbi:MAG: SMI1/KNR4 family protein [Pseudomonadota bacterium]|nr:SMI1/KNR4 family protein [Pseudomonadota bacterium]